MARLYVIILLFGIFLPFSISAQKPVEPGKLSQFNITVNHEDYTVKTQMLSHNKNIQVNNERTYLWYASQKIMETKGGFDGKLIHGKYSAFYLNNQLKEQGTVYYGLKHKEWKYWYEDGKLKEVITWKKGVKNGPYSIYNDYGQIMAKGNFRNDKLDGKFITYGPAGTITEKKKYKDGVEVIAKVKTKKTKQPKIKSNKTQKEVIESEKNKKKDPNKPSLLKRIFKKKNKSDSKKVKTTETAVSA